MSDWKTAVRRKLALSGEVKFSTASAGVTLHVPCAKGDHTVDVTVPLGFHPDGIAKRMLNAGWTIGNKPCCPEHSRKEKVKMAEPEPANGTRLALVAPAPKPPPITILSVSNGTDGVNIVGDAALAAWAADSARLVQIDYKATHVRLVLHPGRAPRSGGGRHNGVAPQPYNDGLWVRLAFRDRARREGRYIHLLFGPTRPLAVNLTKDNAVEIDLPPLAQCAKPTKRTTHKQQEEQTTMALPEPTRDLAAEQAAEKAAPMPTAPEPIMTGERSDAAKIAFRLVMSALEEHYDEVGKTYKAGWNDERIAKDTGAAITVVAKTRDDFFGPVGMPTALAAIMDELGKLAADERAERERFARRVADLHVRLAGLCKLNGWAIPAAIQGDC